MAIEKKYKSVTLWAFPDPENKSCGSEVTFDPHEPDKVVEAMRFISHKLVGRVTVQELPDTSKAAWQKAVAENQTELSYDQWKLCVSQSKNLNKE